MDKYKDNCIDENTLISQISRMRLFAGYLCRNPTDAEDLTQTALARAWRHRSSYVPGTHMKAWLLKIVQNQFYSDRRRSWRVTQLDPEFAEQTLIAVSNPLAALDLADVARAMLELNQEQSQALNLVAIAGYPYEEAAEMCGCPVGTLKSRVIRGRRALEKALAARGWAGDGDRSVREPRDRSRQTIEPSMECGL